MNSDRPISVACVAWIFIAVGTAGVIFHAPEILSLHWDAFLTEFTELLAIVAGIYILRRQNWARWLALAWMAFHVILAAFPPFHGLIVHILIFGGITWLLLRSDAAEYFRGPRNAAV